VVLNQDNHFMILGIETNFLTLLKEQGYLLKVPMN